MRELRKIATVLEELKAKIQQRNCIAEVIEKLGSNEMSMQISFGSEDPITNDYSLEVPEMTFMAFTRVEWEIPRVEWEIHELAKNMFLKKYKARLMQVINDIAALELEEKNIFDTLATPLQDDELQD